MRINHFQLLIIIMALALGPAGCSKSDIDSAAKLGDIEKLRAEIAAGSDINKRGENGNTPLHFATWGGHVECVRILLEHHADVNAVNKDGPHTPLHVAATLNKMDIARLLLEAGAAVSPTDSDGFTPLHYAAAMGNPEIAALLVGKGADLNARNRDRKETPLETAKRKGQDKVVRIIEAASQL
ncbi:MAG: ankyrin repeat domain-containing protein [Syntrophobacteraceae bacterium]